MNIDASLSGTETHYRRILGIQFFVGNATDAVELGSRGGVVVVPAAPALIELPHDREYREALTGADLAITDSGFLVLLWNFLKRDKIARVSGLEYLRLLLARSEFRQPGAAIWVMPSAESSNRNLAWLNAQGYPTKAEDCYLAPRYARGPIVDNALVDLINQRNPRHVIIGLGGGVQEKLGFSLRKRCAARPAIHCIGAAIGFLSGDQVRIPHWADKMRLGWLFRCASQPTRYVPRYAKAWRLPLLLWRFNDRMPDSL